MVGMQIQVVFLSPIPVIGISSPKGIVLFLALFRVGYYIFGISWTSRLGCFSPSFFFLVFITSHPITSLSFLTFIFRRGKSHKTIS